MLLVLSFCQSRVGHLIIAEKRPLTIARTTTLGFPAVMVTLVSVMVIAIIALTTMVIVMEDGITVMGINMDVSVVAMAAPPAVHIEIEI